MVAQFALAKSVHGSVEYRGGSRASSRASVAFVWAREEIAGSDSGEEYLIGIKNSFCEMDVKVINCPH